MFRVLTSALIVWAVGASLVYSQSADPPTDVAQAARPGFRPPTVRVLVAAEASPQPERRRLVLSLYNTSATDVAEAVSSLLQAERGSAAKASAPPDADVIVIPEPLTNSLILSGPPGAVEKLRGLVQSLDQRPPMVQVKMLIVNVSKGQPAQSSHNGPPKDSPILGLSSTSLISAEQLKRELGLAEPGASAAENDVHARIAALQRQGRLRVVCRPQLMTLSNQPATLQIGQHQPVLTGTQMTPTGRVNRIEYRDVGMRLLFTPRASPDGMVVLVIDLQESRLEPLDEGVVIAEIDGRIVHAPQVTTATAKSTVTIADGQTMVLGGLVTKEPPQEQELMILLSAKVIRD